MGRRGAKNKGRVLASGSQGALTLREESSGRKQTKAGSSNVKSILKMQHLQKLAVWASRDASIPSLSAFLGHRLAACGEVMGVPTDPSLFPCERCESILQPGYNCTIRIQKNGTKVQHRCKKSGISTQNNVVYKCHFCCHWNLKRGTPKGHMKEICPSKSKPSSRLEPAKTMVQKSTSSEKGMRDRVEVDNMNKIASTAAARDIPSASSTEKVDKLGEVSSPAREGDIPITSSPSTPLVRTRTTLLEGKRRRRSKSGSKKSAEFKSDSTTVDAEKFDGPSNKRRRKSWTSLKEIAESSERDTNRNAPNLTIPFFV